MSLEGTRPGRGLISDRGSGSRVHARRHEVPADLADVVDTFWTGRWELRGQAPHTTELLGDPAMHIVFEAGDSVPDGHRADVVGVWTVLWTRELRGRGFVRGVKLLPGAVRAFLPLPASTYTNSQRPLADGPSLASVLQPDVAEGLAALTAWLRGARADDEESALAVEMVRWSRATSVNRVDELAEHFSCTVRRAQRLFREHVGAPPKWVIRRFRLVQVAARLDAGADVVLGDLAFELGYADQAHLARDFRAATGRTLTQVRLARR